MGLESFCYDDKINFLFDDLKARFDVSVGSSFDRYLVPLLVFKDIDVNGVSLLFCCIKMNVKAFLFLSQYTNLNLKLLFHFISK